MLQRLILLPFFLFFTSAYAFSPVQQVKVKALVDKKVLRLVVEVPRGSHVYSLFLEDGLGPIRTKVFVEPAIEIPLGDLFESKPLEIYDQAFDTKLLAHQGSFEIMIRLKGRMEAPVRGYLLYQICDNRICSLAQTTSFIAD